MKTKEIFITKLRVKHNGMYIIWNSPMQQDQTVTIIDCKIRDRDFDKADIVHLLFANWQFRGVKSIHVFYSDKSEYYFELQNVDL